MDVTSGAIPFLKWAGGKRWLVYYHHDIFPCSYNRYIEPFLGSGAVFFHLQPRNAILSDTNLELINCYQALKSDSDKVLKTLKQHDRKHCKDYYYHIRDAKPRNIYTRAARFIYLNRTCWNGLYRVNLNGQFNVPIGTKNNILLDTDTFDAVSKQLKGAEIRHSDFETVIDEAEKNDLIFIDPPYTVKHNYNGFIKYNETLFNWEDQLRLRDATVRAKQRGAQIVLTNADHKSIRALYRNDFDLYRVNRESVLAANSSFRGKVHELLVIA